MKLVDSSKYAQKRILSICKWLTNIDNQILIEGNCKAKFLEYQESGMHPGILSNYVQRYGHWLFSRGIVSASEGDASGPIPDDLFIGFSCYYLAFLLRCHQYQFDAKRMTGICSLHDAAMWMSIGYTLGLPRHASIMGEVVVDGIPKQMFSDIHTVMGAYIPKIWAKFHGRSVPLPAKRAREPAEYNQWKSSPIWDNLTESIEIPDQARFQHDLSEACSWHKQESKYPTNSKRYEFDLDERQLFPSELFMLMRFRADRGLPVHDISDELFWLPFEKIRNLNGEIQFDKHIGPVFEKLKREYPLLEGGWVSATT